MQHSYRNAGYQCKYTTSVIGWCSVGVGICRGLRYPELALHYAKKGSYKLYIASFIFANSFSYVPAYLPNCINSTLITGCKLLCYPSAYNVHIGSAHWELMLRAR